MKKNIDFKAAAYSYVRFSTAKQELGDSLRRQVTMAEDYCLKNGLDLQPVSFRDLGVSAFKRANIEKGALAAFIDAVEKGTIAKGSYLVIEQFDRLSRADINIALMLLLELVEKDIIVVTLADGKVWDKNTVKDIQNLLIAIIFMSKANAESADKSRRLKAAWEQKQKSAAVTGKILTRECPRWLTVDPDKSCFSVLQDRVESIQKVFEMRIKGMGAGSIVSRANTEKWPVPGKGTTWHTSLVGRLLHNRALLGEYQPHVQTENGRVASGSPILGFYPIVLEANVFLRARAVMNRRGNFPGKRDVAHRNFLQGLLTCSCGHSFVRKNKNSSKQSNYARYYCTARIRQLTNCPSVAPFELETAIINALVTAGPEFFDGSIRLKELKRKSEEQEVAVTAAKDKRKRYLDAIGFSKKPLQALVQELNVAEDEVANAENELFETMAEAAEIGGDSTTIMNNISKIIYSDNSVEALSQLREDLAKILQKCIVDSKLGTLELYLRGKSETLKVPLVDIAGQAAIVMPNMTNSELHQFAKNFGDATNKIDDLIRRFAPLGSQ